MFVPLHSGSLNSWPPLPHLMMLMTEDCGCLSHGAMYFGMPSCKEPQEAGRIANLVAQALGTEGEGSPGGAHCHPTLDGGIVET